MKNEQVPVILEDFDVAQYQHDLIHWFKQEQRILPWRANQDPYKVWVSEIMLQQTRVDTVIPYFENFMSQFPTLEDLAYADEERVLKAWEGLGYYSRARNLQTAVREVVENYEGRVPHNEKELSSLKGVGPYTKGAILSIAYGIPSPAVDGNVMRVLSRILFIENDIAKPATRKLFENIIREIISQEDPSSFNQGLMELGALVCTPKSPSCMLCPVQEHCRAFHAGKEQLLPVKSSKKKQKRKPYMSLLLKDEHGRILVEKRPDDGLLANLWQFPMVSLEEHNRLNVEKWIQGEYGLQVSLGSTVDNIKHTFSHVIWDLEVMTGEIKSGELDKSNARLSSPEEMEQLPFPVSHQKMMKHL
ncbi:DNA glycosylase [Pontibacillus halophilus JSM 076056 = DSM 19796]|uniref:Adenine DNA glycosylase n=1 Tax=Pontibacillus halophilus JSM 076056 = DSM 19796 TaxID=1385510 RepID=A0A0A5HUW0_9BACI|nr:A/G-specific adenine glycosylase [Pontibacillus halophilus]KGX87417.1 DNA glycosylase [Pontibacillus halophilus JSM 076056 = DSM 19796]